MDIYNIVDSNRRSNKSVVILRHDETIDSHSHPGNGEEITVVAGFVRVHHGNLSTALQEGDKVTIPAKEDHSATAVGGTAVFVSKMC